MGSPQSVTVGDSHVKSFILAVQMNLSQQLYNLKDECEFLVYKGKFFQGQKYFQPSFHVKVTSELFLQSDEILFVVLPPLPVVGLHYFDVSYLKCINLARRQ